MKPSRPKPITPKTTPRAMPSLRSTRGLPDFLDSSLSVFSSAVLSSEVDAGFLFEVDVVGAIVDSEGIAVSEVAVVSEDPVVLKGASVSEGAVVSDGVAVSEGIVVSEDAVVAIPADVSERSSVGLEDAGVMVYVEDPITMVPGQDKDARFVGVVDG